jgi:chromosome segregation ATPase
MNHLIRPAIIASTLALLLSAATVSAAMYRYKDENGQVVISNTIPQEASKRGYDILSSDGRVIDTVAPAPTEEELAERAAEKRRQEARARRMEQDRKLLERYSNPDQAVRAMHRKIMELRGLSQLKQGNISVIENQLDAEQAKAADLERAGRDIPEATLKKIRRLEADIREIEQEINAQKAEIEAVKRQFLEDIKRLEIITDQQRTVPLEVPSDKRSK